MVPGLPVLAERFADERDDHVVAQRDHFRLDRDVRQVLDRANPAGDAAAVSHAGRRLGAERERGEDTVDGVLQHGGNAVYDHALATGVTAALTIGAGATVLALVVTLVTIRVRRQDLPDSPLVM